MGMELRELKRVNLTESLIFRRARLQAASAEAVVSLNLQGTHTEKILSLGDAFKNFKSLRSLDLSRNVIVSLRGIEYLHSLRYLNLYFNDIISKVEIERLRCLSQLKSLDLRLNPVTRLDADYRLFIVHILGSLESLDDRPVMDSERKVANFNFCLNNYKSQENPNRDSGSHTLGETTTSKSHGDFITSSTKTELSKFDNWKQDSPSKYQSEELQPYAQTQGDYEDGIEYRPLPSPTRSSMRSPGPSSRAKEGQRVTFSDSTLSQFTPKKEEFAKHLESDDFTSTRKPVPNNTDKSRRDFNFKNTYLTFTPVKKDAPVSERMKADTRTPHDEQRPTMRENAMPSSNSEESSRERLLRLSSELYVTTHLNESPTSSNSLAAIRKGFNDVSKAYTLPSKPTVTNTYLSRPEFSRENKRIWSPNSGSCINNETGSMLPTGLKRTSSLNSLLNPRSSSIVLDSNKDDVLLETELKKTDFPNPEVPPITKVLQQLLELVDRYWSSSEPILQNQRFLVPARDLLSQLTVPNPSVEQKRDSRSSPGHEEPDKMESLKLKMVKLMEENHFLRGKISKLENQASRKEGSGHMTLAHDDLWQKYEQLRQQVQSLQQQLNMASSLQETVNLLHNSQRSLVSTNEYLLQQLKNNSSTEATKPPCATSPTRINPEKYIYQENTEQLPTHAAHSPERSWDAGRLRLIPCPL